MQQVNAVDDCPTVVTLAKLLLLFCNDAATFAILDHFLQKKRRGRTIGPLEGSESTVALHQVFEDFLWASSPLTAAALAGGLRDPALEQQDALLADMRLGAVSRAIFPGLMATLLPPSLAMEVIVVTIRSSLSSIHFL
jgi:hypothetical protein